MVSLTIAIVLATPYLALQLFYIYHWRNTPVTIQAPKKSNTAFSVIIVARNEENAIEDCIHSIFQQDYPSDKTEIIVVNDRSNDRTIEIIKSINDEHIRLVHLHEYPDFIHSPAFKKSGIELGVHLATHDWIIVTDADCIHHANWLNTIAGAIETHDHVFFAAPLLLHGNDSIFNGMQESENLALMLVTAAGIQSGLHDMANGANMIFSKKVFATVNGYDGNYQYSSGDDMFLIEKIRKQFPHQVSFIKSTNAVVTTQAKETWESFIQQRLRWAGKNTGLRGPAIPVIWGFIGLYHLALLTSFLLSIFNIITWWPFLILLMTKWISDFIVMNESASFFGKKINILQFIPQQMLYSFYLGYLGLMLLLKKKSDW